MEEGKEERKKEGRNKGREEGGRQGGMERGKNVGRTEEKEGFLGCGKSGALYSVVRMEFVIRASSAEITGEKYKWEPYNPAAILVATYSRHRIQVLRSGCALPCSRQ